MSAGGQIGSGLVWLGDVASKCLPEVGDLLGRELPLRNEMKEVTALEKDEDLVIFNELHKDRPLNLRREVRAFQAEPFFMNGDGARTL